MMFEKIFQDIVNTSAQTRVVGITFIISKEDTGMCQWVEQKLVPLGFNMSVAPQGEGFVGDVSGVNMIAVTKMLT